MPITRKHVIGGASAAAIALVAFQLPKFEGEDRVAKHNKFDPAGVITVCNGVTNYVWPWLKEGMTLSHEQCQDAIKTVVPKYADPIAACIPQFATWGPHRQAAWIMFAYNLGTGRVCGGTIGAALKAGQDLRACDLMLGYTRAAGQELPGLVTRRRDERAWCVRED